MSTPVVPDNKDEKSARLTLTAPAIPEELKFLKPPNALYKDIIKHTTILLTLYYLKAKRENKEPFDNATLYSVFFFIIGLVVYYEIVLNIAT